MSKSIEDILSEMRNNPKGVRFADACRVVSHYFGEPRQSGTSHRVWKMPWAGDPRINMQKGDSGMAKAYQVRQAVFAIDRLVAQQATAKPQPTEPHDEKKKSRRPKTRKKRK